jgi:hypothetical protein
MSGWFKSPILSYAVPDVGYDMSDFVVGDRLRTRHYFYHEGIYVGPRGPNGESIVHNDYDAKRVILTHPEGYTRKDRPIHLAERTPEAQREVVAEKAMSMLGTPFDLTQFNCQHFTRLVQHGVAYSPRVQAMALSLGVSILIGVAIIGIWSGTKRYHAGKLLESGAAVPQLPVVSEVE